MKKISHHNHYSDNMQCTMIPICLSTVLTNSSVFNKEDFLDFLFFFEFRVGSRLGLERLIYKMRNKR